MCVEAQLVEPVHSTRKVAALPTPQFPCAGGVERVVVADQASVIETVKPQRITRSGPQNVVPDVQVGGVGLQADGVSRRLIDSVVDDIHAAGAIIRDKPNTLVGVG